MAGTPASSRTGSGGTTTWPLTFASAPAGALYEAFPRLIGATLNQGVLVSQRVTLVAIELPTGLAVTSITFLSGTTAMSVGVHQFFGLYDSSRNLLRGSVDDTSNSWGSNATKTLALTSAFTTTYAGLHYLAILVQATTVPSLTAQSTSTAMAGLAPILSGTSDTGVSALPNPAAALTVSGTIPYCYVS